MGNNTDKRMVSQDFVRAVCCVAMVAYHYSVHLSENAALLPLKNHANGLWGEVIVTVFFAMSGALLYKNNQIVSKEKLKKYYIKRWKSIFPLFYTVFLLVYFNNVLNSGSFFYRGHPESLLLSVFGLDGYLSIYGVYTYYICGEWFLGALIILYLFYPLLLYVFNKNSFLVTGVILCYYLIKQFTGIGVHHMWTDVFSCILSFEIGMFFMKHNLFKSQITIAAAWIICIFTLVIDLPGPDYFWNHITGLALYCVLNFLGEFFCRTNCIEKLANGISKLSYSIYLVHHLLIVRIINNFQPISEIQVLLCLFFAVSFSFLYGWMASLVSSRVVLGIGNLHIERIRNYFSA